LALSGLPNEGRSIRAAFFVPQIPAWSSPADRLGLIDHSESAGRPRCLRIIENIIAERPTSANTSQPTKKFDHKVAYLKLAS